MFAGRSANFFSVYDFAENIKRAAKGIVLVSSQTNGMPLSTGWLITDNLVVVPRYVLNQVDDIQALKCSYYSTSQRRMRTTQARLVSDRPPPQLNPGSLDATARIELQKPALLQLTTGRTKASLSLELSTPREGDDLFILHHPEGNPSLQLSIGQMISIHGAILRHNADTMHGSSGSPIFNSHWKVVAMHVGTAHEGGENEGLTLATVLESLQLSPLWKDIAGHHRLADVQLVWRNLEQSGDSRLTPVADELVTAAAVRWDFPSTSLNKKSRHRLRPLVIDPNASRWVMRGAERERAVRAAGSMDALRRARDSSRLTAKQDGMQQQVIDAILNGPPFVLSEISEDALPYWLQAVRWFSSVIRELPSPGDVSRELDRRRIRSRLELLAGKSFRGRETELKSLKEWFGDLNAGPMMVSGIGGIGKSALIAQFALELPHDSFQFWLDFDRPDLTPDDAVSVINALVHQASVQIAGIEASPISETTTDAWNIAAKQFGRELTQHKKQGALLVLDSFEVAQYVRKHHEIWKLLELIVAEAPHLRVVVSGRAPIKELSLGRRKAKPLPLVGMDRDVARQWLRDWGNEKKAGFANWFAELGTLKPNRKQEHDRKAGEQILDICGGIPLRLKLATRWLENGGKIAEIPRTLPQSLVEGFLYQRILDRVIDSTLKPVAKAALVLRQVRSEMVGDVLGPELPAGSDFAETFERLALEMAFVGAEVDSTVSAPTSAPSSEQYILRVRSEVRAATLRLLELDDPEMVHAVDQWTVLPSSEFSW